MFGELRFAGSGHLRKADGSLWKRRLSRAAPDGAVAVNRFVVGVVAVWEAEVCAEPVAHAA